MLWHFLRGWISLLPPTQMHVPGPCSQYPGPCSHVRPGGTLVIWYVSRMCSAYTILLINSTGSCLMISLLTHFLPLENTALSLPQILLMLRETESLWHLNRRCKATCMSRWSKCAGGGALRLLRRACLESHGFTCQAALDGGPGCPVPWARGAQHPAEIAPFWQMQLLAFAGEGLSQKLRSLPLKMIPIVFIYKQLKQ